MNLKIDGLILAAGKSGRLGYPKQILRYNNKFFITNVFEKISKVCQSIVIVLGYNSDLIREKFEQEIVFDNSLKFGTLNKLKYVYNNDFEKGMFSSIQAGLVELIDSEYILIHKVDQPSIPEQFYKMLIQEIDREVQILQPLHNKKRGHPIIINNSVAKKILKANSDTNLREIRKNNSFTEKLWECEFPEILIDIDTPNDYNDLTRGEKL